MKSMLRTSTMAAVVAAFIGTAAPTFADPPFCPPGHAKKGECGYDRNNDRDEARAYRDGYQDGKRDAIRYNGRDYTDYSVITDYGRYHLTPPPNGYYYAEVDDKVLMVSLATQVVTQLLTNGF